jgi:hypothetical protein
LRIKAGSCKGSGLIHLRSRHGQFIKNFLDDRFAGFKAKPQRRRKFQLFQPRERELSPSSACPKEDFQ